MSYPLILALDSGGTATGWITWQDAVTYEAKNLVEWSLGEITFTFMGGKSRLTGEQSSVTTASIIAIKGQSFGRKKHYRVPALTNRTLFRRDHQICAYCGDSFKLDQLTRDHIIPVSRDGKDTWMNCVTSCKRCNNRKDDRLLEEAHMELLYVPYVPDRNEYLILQNRNILADQMSFLASQVKNKDSRIFNFQ